MNQFFSLALAAGVLAAINATASATIYVTHVHESHTNISGGGGQVVSDFSPGSNSFSTFDGFSGFQSTMNSNGGSVSFTAYGKSLNQSNGASPIVTGLSGSIDFTVADSALTLTQGDFVRTAGVFGGTYTVTNLSSGQIWRWQEVKSPQSFPPLAPPTGDLVIPAAPGQYRLDFSGSTSVTTGFAGPGTMTINLATTPEPTTIVTFVLPTFAVLRRRR